MPYLSRRFLLAGMALCIAAGPSLASSTILRNPGCECCHRWVEHMRAGGFDLTMTDTDDLQGQLAAMGVPAELQGCHGGLIEGKVFSGHIPVEDIKQFLALNSEAIGLTVPGMPMNSPGMESTQPNDTYVVYMIGKDGTVSEFAKHM